MGEGVDGVSLEMPFGEIADELEYTGESSQGGLGESSVAECGCGSTGASGTIMERGSFVGNSLHEGLGEGSSTCTSSANEVSLVTCSVGAGSLDGGGIYGSRLVPSVVSSRNLRSFNLDQSLFLYDQYNHLRQDFQVIASQQDSYPMNGVSCNFVMSHLSSTTLRADPKAETWCS